MNRHIYELSGERGWLRGWSFISSQGVESNLKKREDAINCKLIEFPIRDSVLTWLCYREQVPLSQMKLEWDLRDKFVTGVRRSPFLSMSFPLSLPVSGISTAWCHVFVSQAGRKWGRERKTQATTGKMFPGLLLLSVLETHDLSIASSYSWWYTFLDYNDREEKGKRHSLSPLLWWWLPSKSRESLFLHLPFSFSCLSFSLKSSLSRRCLYFFVVLFPGTCFVSNAFFFIMKDGVIIYCFDHSTRMMWYSLFFSFHHLYSLIKLKSHALVTHYSRLFVF